MFEPLGRHVTGQKQTLRALGDGTALCVYIAADAEEKITSPVRRAALEKGVTVTQVDTMAELGRRCGIKIGAAVAAEIKG